jgi:O-antigen/teichoic acid export membrane protein
VNISRDAASGMGWSVVEKWSTRLVSLVVLLVLGRLLTPDQFGLVALGTVFMTFLNIFVDQGFGRALVQRKTITDAHTNTAFWMSLGGSIVLAAVLIVGAPLISSVLGEPALEPVVQVMSIGLVLYALSSIPQALLEREFGFKSLARRRVIATLVGGVCAVIAAAVGLGVWSLVLQTLVTSAVGVVVLWTASTWRPRFVVSLRAARELWPTGASVIGIEFVGFLNGQSDKLIVGAALDATALGYYFFAMRIISIMIELFSTVMSSISLTTFSRLQDDRAELQTWMYRLSAVSCLVAIPAFAVLASVAQEAIPLIFGSQWAPSSLLVQILCVLGAVNAIAVFDRSALLAVGRNRLAFSLTLGQALIGIVFVFAALPFGVVGVAIAVAVRQIIWWPVRLIALRAALGISPVRYLSIWLRPTVVGLVAAAVSYSVISLVRDLSALPIVYVLVGISISCVLIVALGSLMLRGPFRELMLLVRQRRSGGRK